MDFADIKNRSTTELNEMLGEWKAELRELRARAYSRSLKQVNKIAVLKRQVAQVMTVLKEKNK